MPEATPDSRGAPSENRLAQFLKVGPGRWFDLDFGYFATELSAFAGGAPVPTAIPVRLETLLAAVATETTPAYCETLADKALAAQDADAAAVACTVAIDRIIHEGVDYERLRGWAERADRLLDDRSTISMLARCALLLRRGLIAFVADCDMAATERFYEQQLAIAIEVRSVSQRLQYAAWHAFLDCQSGPLDRSDIILTEALSLCDQPDVPLLPRAMVTSSLGMVKTLQGQTETACDILRKASESPDFARLPPFAQSTLLCHRIHALAHTDRRDEMAGVAAAIRRYTVPENRAFLHGYLHFALGAAELRRNAPRRALLHAEQGQRSCGFDSSRLSDNMQPLLRLQALSDLRRDGEAFDLLDEWLPRWKSRRMDRVAAVAMLEKSHLHARSGEFDRARRAFLSATRMLPEDEPLFPVNRDAGWLQTLRGAILPPDRTGGGPTDVPIRIRTLGTFSVEIEGQVIYDRDWRGRRSKMFLQGLIALDGQKVSCDELADLVWPDSDGVQAQQNLKAILWRLRRLGRDDGTPPLNWIHVRHGRISLPHTLCSIDAIEFQTAATAALAAPATDSGAIRHAIDLYRGEFLAGESNSSVVITCRQRLHQLWTRLQKRQAELEGT